MSTFKQIGFLPTPVLVGVAATMFPITGPVLAGLLTTTVIYTGLSLFTDQNETPSAASRAA